MPRAAATCTDQFTYLVNDGKNDSNIANVNIANTSCGLADPTAGLGGAHAPVARSQSLSTAAGVPLQVPLSASDEDGDSLGYRIATLPSHGLLSALEVQDGQTSLTYTPAAGFGGSDQFAFIANDGVHDSGEVTVAITVTGGGAGTTDHTLTLTRSGQGLVTSSPAGIACDPDCLASFSDVTTVTLTALPASGYGFTGWSGACMGTGSCTLTLDTDRAVTATFTLGTDPALVIALYDAYFLRAPDQSGYDYWNSLVPVSAAFADASSAFFNHPYAQITLGYGNLSDREFATAIYTNVLRGTGSDTPGETEIGYWADWLTQPDHTRPGMVLQFVTDALTYPVDTLSDPAARLQAQHRQDTLKNKIRVAQSFMDRLGARTNVSAAAGSDPAVLATDPAFLAGQKILSGVTYDPATVDSATNFIANTAASSADPMNAINAATGHEIFGP